MKKIVVGFVVACVLACVLYRVLGASENTVVSQKENIISMKVVKRNLLKQMTFVDYYSDVLYCDVVNGDTIAIVIGQPHLEYGIDLSKVNEGDLYYEGDTLCVNLPSAQLLPGGKHFNPDEREIVESKQAFANDYEKRIKIVSDEILKIAEKEALENGVIERVENGGMEFVAKALSVLVDKPVRVTIKSTDNSFFLPVE